MCECVAPVSPDPLGSLLFNEGEGGGEQRGEGGELNSVVQRRKQGTKHRRAKSAILQAFGWNRGNKSKTAPGHDGGSSVGGKTQKEIYQDVARLEILHDTSVPKRPRGISNLGNSCFLGTAIQCFLATPGLVVQLVPDLVALMEGFDADGEEEKAQSADKEEDKIVDTRADGEGEVETVDSHLSHCDVNDDTAMSEQTSTDKVDDEEGIESESIKDVCGPERPEKGALFDKLVQTIKSLFLYSRDDEAVDIGPLVAIMKRFTTLEDYMDGRQQDGSEVLLAVMDALHEDLNRIENKEEESIEKSDSTDQVGDSKHEKSEEEKAQRAWELCTSKCQSIISDTFMGQLQSSVMCSRCHESFTMYEPFMELSLSLAPKPSNSIYSWLGLKGNISLKDCIFEFTSDDILQGDERFSCETCKDKTEAVKHLRINHLPDALILHIKRFQFKGKLTGKLENFVKFPIRGLDLRDHIAIESPHSPEECIYDLYAVANHSGSLTMGHYTASVLQNTVTDTRKVEQTWWHYNDETVTRLKEDELVSPKAYVLFYSRRRFQEKEAACAAYRNLSLFVSGKSVMNNT